jgi:hypothetical protein
MLDSIYTQNGEVIANMTRTAQPQASLTLAVAAGSRPELYSRSQAHIPNRSEATPIDASNDGNRPMSTPFIRCKRVRPHILRVRRIRFNGGTTRRDQPHDMGLGTHGVPRRKPHTPLVV